MTLMLCHPSNSFDMPFMPLFDCTQAIQTNFDAFWLLVGRLFDFSLSYRLCVGRVVRPAFKRDIAWISSNNISSPPRPYPLSKALALALACPTPHGQVAISFNRLSSSLLSSPILLSFTPSLVF